MLKIEHILQLDVYLFFGVKIYSERNCCLVMVNCMVAEGPEFGRHNWIDALRLVAGISMVGLHVSADAQGLPFPEATASERVGPMLLRSLLYMARTELFLMISILLLLMALKRRPRSYAATLGIQARRLLVPFVFWTLFYAVYGLLKAQAFGYLEAEVARVTRPQAWVGFLLLGDVKYHMHFIPTLFALLLFFPLFRAAERSPILGLLVLVFLMAKHELDTVLYARLWGADVLPYLLRLVKVTTYIGYGMATAAVLGLWRRSTISERESWVGPALLLIGFLFVFKLNATWITIQTGRWVFDYAPGYWADFLMPVMLLLVCMSLGHRRWPTGVARLSKYAFGIYLCHPIFLDLAEIALRGRAVSPMTSIGLELMWTLPMTGLWVLMLARSPATAWTIGLGAPPRLPVWRDRRRIFR